MKNFVVDYNTETFEPLMEHEVNGLDYKYVYGNDRLSVDISPINNSGHIVENGDHVRLYYHMDYLGTADYLTSPVSGKVEAWTHYNEWGLISHNAVLKCGQRELDLVKRYATHDYDSVLELYYAKARFYDAHDRRFTAVDPILDPSQYDLREYVTDPVQLVQYLYVQNQPLVYIDPTGLFFDKAGQWIADRYNDVVTWGAERLEDAKQWVVNQLNGMVTSITNAIGNVTKHFTNNVRRTDLEQGIVASIIINAGDSGAAILQSLINTRNILTGQLPSMWYYEHYLKTSRDIDTYFASNSVFKDSYYLGKTLGDVISAGLGIGMTAKGIVDFLTGASAAIGGAASAGTGIGAIIATAGAAHAAAGIAEGTAGIAVAATAAGNFGGDFQKFQCESKNDISDYLDDWGKGRSSTPEENIKGHFDKHGSEVRAKNLQDYCRKARAFRDTVLNKGSRIKPRYIPGYTDDVYRWVFNGKYIDMQIIVNEWGAKTYKIISYGCI